MTKQHLDAIQRSIDAHRRIMEDSKILAHKTHAERRASAAMSVRPVAVKEEKRG